MAKEIMYNPLIRHILSIATILVMGGFAWGALGSDVQAIKEKAESRDIRINKNESRGISNSEKLSRVDERTKLILDMVKEINRKMPVRGN